MQQFHGMRTFAAVHHRPLPCDAPLRAHVRRQAHDLKHHSPMTQPQYSDSDYVEAFQRNDEAILDAFQREARKAFAKMMLQAKYRSIDPYTKNNIFSDVLTELWEKAYRNELVSTDGIVEIGREGHREPLTRPLVAYFMGIVRHKAHASWAQGKDTTLVDDFSSFGEEPALDIEADEPDAWRRVVWVCVNEMPKRCQELMDLFFVQGLSDQAVLQLRSRQHGEQMSSKGLKSAKSGCLKSLRQRVRALCKQRGIHITTALAK